MTIDVGVPIGESSEAEQPGSISVWHRPVRTNRCRVNQSIALSILGDNSVLLSWLNRKDDSTVRTELIHRLAAENVAPGRLVRWLDSPLAAEHPGIRSAIIQALGEYKVDQFVAISRAAVADKVAGIRVADSDPGVHASATWLLQKWQMPLAAVTREWSGDGAVEWITETNGHILVAIHGPVAFDMGSRVRPKLFGSAETFHHRTIGRNFAIGAHEVTWKQFGKSTRHRPDTYSFFYSKNPDGTVNEQTPANHVNWYRAVEYCNWLSEQAGLPKDQWCYLPNDEGEYGLGMKVAENFLERTGYRLPTEAEWEYAARAGSSATRFFGQDSDRLGQYAHYRTNSNIRTWSVGLLKPNELGLFDIYGNVWEWCHGSRDEPWPKFLEAVDDQPGDLPLADKHHRTLRGGAFIMPVGAIRSAMRSFNRPSNEQFTIGFRVARTLPSPVLGGIHNKVEMPKVSE